MRRTLAHLEHKQAIIFLRDGRVETELSFGRLDQDSESVAQTFVEMGVREGDRTIILLPKCVDWVVAHIALQKIGAVCVPLNPDFKKDEVEYFFHDTQPRLAVVGHDQEEMVKQIDPNVALFCVDAAEPYLRPPDSGKTAVFQLREEGGLEDPALIVFTSGTTGRPKGAVLTRGNLSHDARNVVNIWEISQNDTFCHALPLFHVHGLCFGLHTSLMAGATTIMLDTFNAGVVLDNLARKETSMFMAVPTMYSKLIARHPSAEVDYSHLRLLTSGSAPLLEKDFKRIQETFGIEPVEREGMSETLMNFSNPLRGKRKPGSIGLPLPHLEVRIVDPEISKDIQPGEVGEIWLKGPAITPGYWQKPEETARAFKDGWFRTGDLGRKDEDGYYYLTDRLKNIIISGGENISPREIELVINANEDVLESVVIGIPDETWGEIVAAVIAVKSGSTITPVDITSLCKERLLSWKCPKKILIVNELPKNRMGKILTDRVKELFGSDC